jgi:threonine dehydratase
MELLRQHPGPIHSVFIPVGGGGLIAGMAAYIKRLRPEIKIVGVEPEDADSMARSLCKGTRVTLPRVGIFADGVAVKKVGKETFRLSQLYVDEVIRVNNDAICAAIKDVFEDTRSILEPAGALSIAGLKAAVAGDKLRGKTLVAVASGANMNFDRLRYIAERAELGEKREAVLAVTIPETPGSFKNFCSLLGARNITEFNYRYSDPKQARVFVGLSVPGDGESSRVVELLQRHGLEAVDLTDNEMAKLHVRHLVGGRAPEAVNEVLYRFEFPERPGALMQFLQSMSRGWNISLFHYRNHGADYGRVLVGIQVPEKEKPSFQKFLDRLGYRYWDESRNPAYKLFLG